MRTYFFNVFVLSRSPVLGKSCFNRRDTRHGQTHYISPQSSIMKSAEEKVFAKPGTLEVKISGFRASRRNFAFKWPYLGKEVDFHRTNAEFVFRSSNIIISAQLPDFHT